MAKKSLKAVLSLVVALMFVLQTVPMYSFAENAQSTDYTAQTADNQGADESNTKELNYVIDDNGNQVDLTDEMREQIYSGDDTGLYSADSDSFFDYEDGEVEIATETMLDANFENSNVGDTSVDGWLFKVKSKGGNAEKSKISVENAPDGSGKALLLNKIANGAMNGSFNASDDGIYAIRDLKDMNLKGKIIVSADLYISNPGRLGMFAYSQCDNIEDYIDGKIMTDDGKAAPIPYIGQTYFWTTGSDTDDPSKVTPSGFNLYDYSKKPEKIEERNAGWSANNWYTIKFDIDTDKGTYSSYVTDANGSKVDTHENMKLQQGASEYVYGIGLVVQSDQKSLGSCYVKNLKVIDNNSAEADAQAVVADKNALAIPDGLDANNITADFTLPLKGSYGSVISWTSSNPQIASVDSATGNVKITRPEYSGQGSYGVLLDATISSGLATDKKSLSIRVSELDPQSDSGKASMDIDNVELPANVKPTMVDSGFAMPTSGQYGSTITYVSSNTEILSVDASGNVTVNMPEFTGAGTQVVSITATAKCGSATKTKVFELNVKEQAPTTDAQKAIYDANNALIGGVDINNIRQENFYLSDKGEYGSLSWTSLDDRIKVETNYITSDGGNNDEGNGDQGIITGTDGFKATVTRPEKNSGNASVTLTVTANVNGAVASKDFTLTLIEKDGLKAFPSVEGYGSYSAGGRGGQVYHVTNLNADGPGSFGYGIEQVKGARTIVFDVGGVIDLTPLGRPLAIKGEKYSNVTVAGQTAPYPGITLKGYGLNINSAHDVIVRNIKIRIGDVFETGAYNQSDPMSVGTAKRVVVDHCSMQWSIDMDFRISGENITFSNTIFGKNLSANSPHEKGGHAYVGAINEGSSKVSFIKNFLGDSTQRTPRIVDATWVDAYNNLLYNCGNGFDINNYEWQDKNAKMNVYNNHARTGPNQSNSTPYRAGRGRVYAGGIMVYYGNNYSDKNGKNPVSRAKYTTAKVYDENGKETGKVDTVHYTLDFGKENAGTYNAGYPASAYDLRNVTLKQWDTNPASYNNEGKSDRAATMTYMDYKFPAPRGEVMDVINGNSNNIVEYARSENGVGATRPARDLYDTMIIKEMTTGSRSSASMTADEVAPFFDALEARVEGLDYSAYKTARAWSINQGVGPTLRGAANDAGKTKPVHWDDYTDVNKNTNPNASSKYDSKYVTNFEIGDWWGQYCGALGQQMVYTLYDTKLDRTFTTTNGDYDQTRYELVGQSYEYPATVRTVADLYPADWMKNDDYFKDAADAMENYRKQHYAKRNTYDKIIWDSMGDGIPNWYKEYRGWSTSKYIANDIDPETGYTYLELYLQFMAGDKPANIDMTPASIENFKVIQSGLGYSTAQLSWNTDYRTSCVIEYGTEPGKYTNSEVLEYDDETENMHTYHDIVLYALEPDTQYYYKVTATDEYGKTTTADYSNNQAMTFKTTVAPEGSTAMLPDQPVITGTVPYFNQVRVNWEGHPATDEGYEIYYDDVDHGEDYVAYAHRLTGLDASESKLVITELENNKPYYFLVVAVNSNGKTASKVATAIPSGTIINYDFTKMTEEEKDRFMKEEFMYTLGGAVTMQKDPDTGENVLQMLDETNSHGVNSNIKFPVTQEDKFTYEIKMKVLYQKQTDALNGNAYDTGNNNTFVTTTGKDEHNTWQINFSKDPILNDDKDSTKSLLWEGAFSIFFDAQSTPISTTNVKFKPKNGSEFNGDRFDGTVEQPTLKFASTEIGTYNIGKTSSCTGTLDSSIPSKKNNTSLKDVVKGNLVLPYGETNATKGTGYEIGTYNYLTPYGDAVYTHQESTGKTLHGMWYYEKGSAKFVTYKIVVDPIGNNVAIYADNQLVYKQGEFSEDLDEPYNIGKIEIKSRNDGYSWVNVASIKAYKGDGNDDITVTPVEPGRIPNSPGGPSGGGGGGSVMTPNPSATPAASEEPAASSEPTQAPISADANKYFDDLGSVAWAVESINTLAEAGIVTGTGDRQFSPEVNVTRAEFVTMLMRAYGGDITPAELTFSDVNAGEWYYEPIAKAVALGSATGYDNGSFGINDNISREDMMVMAYRTMKALNIAVPKSKDYENFSDQGAISDYAEEAIEAMYCAGIINGVGSNQLNPKGNADRAQSAKILYGLTNMEGTVNE